MSEDVLETLIRKQIESRVAGQRRVLFAWQGGEPTMVGVRFFEKVVALQRQYAPPKVQITNAIQTNGVLISDDFARFFHDHQFLVGVVDGPEEMYNRFRHTISGQGSFKAVMNGIEVLNRHRKEYNILTVVQSDNSRFPEEVYGFVKSLGSPFIQFIPIVEADAQQTCVREQCPAINGTLPKFCIPQVARR